MPLQFKLEHVTEQLIGTKKSNERRLIKALAGVRLSAKDARAVWPRILDHKWYVSERLGRDVGLKVAVTDFFENVQPRPKSHSSRDLLPPRLPFMGPLMGFTESFGNR